VLVPVHPLQAGGVPGEVYFPVAHTMIRGGIANINSWYTPPSQRIFRAARSWSSAQHQYQRVHAGVDIYTEDSVEVYACAAGKVVKYSGSFTSGVGGPVEAIAIEHENTHVGKIIVRYCELRGVPSDLRHENAIVTARRVIGKTWPVVSSGRILDHMLHLETYRGTDTGNFSVSGGGELVNISFKGQATSQTQAKTNRRADLIDPYDFLIGCINNSPE
jgi:hypothetical protein